MAIYHCSVRCITRSEGRSAVAAAAYRSGEKLTNDYDGIVHDYTKKGWIVHKEIMLPANAPEEFRDRSKLWNAVETVERSASCRLAREVQLALPIEFTMQENIELVREYVLKNFVSKGMCVDIAIHNPPKMDDRHCPIDCDGNPTNNRDKMQFYNPHAHILLTVRSIDEKGKWQAKSQVEYLCKRDSEERGFTADEFKQAKNEGWEKQYRFMASGKKVWLPASEGKQKGLERVSKAPKTARFGRENETCKIWNSEESVIKWRKSWEDIVNERFRQIQMDIRIDSRSFIDQGRDEEIPMIHLGPAATHMVRRAEHLLAEGKKEELVARPDSWFINQEIRKHNHMVRELAMKLMAATAAIREEAKHYIEEIALKLEKLRTAIISTEYASVILEKHQQEREAYLKTKVEKISYLKGLSANADLKKKEAEVVIRALQDKMKKLGPLEFRKKRVCQKQLEAENQKINMIDNYVLSEMKKYGFDLYESFISASQQYVDNVKIDMEQNKTEIYTHQVETIEKAYADVLSDVSEEYISELEEKCQNFRNVEEKSLVARLKDYYKNEFNIGLYKQIVEKADNKIRKIGGERHADNAIQHISKRIQRKH